MKSWPEEFYVLDAREPEAKGKLKRAEPMTCRECSGGDGQVRRFGVNKFYVCCSRFTCEHETRPYEMREDAVRDWNGEFYS